MSLAAFRIEQTAETVTVYVRGQVDLTNADDFSAAVSGAGASTEPAPGRVWVDLSEASFFDSAGVNALFALNDVLLASGCALGVVAPQLSPARRVLDIVQLGRLMPLKEAGPP